MKLTTASEARAFEVVVQAGGSWSAPAVLHLEHFRSAVELLDRVMGFLSSGASAECRYWEITVRPHLRPTAGLTFTLRNLRNPEEIDSSCGILWAIARRTA